ncbi:MAG TPA: ArsA-related P-loop ATPase [Acidimicrobiales bacterium]|nr:ArsA-related P-loop ATPase [Acidimicrobiales bacterium]
MSSDLDRPVLEQLVADREIVVCCGPGGVGKTTVAASLALECARRGGRACVVTIDPARRLANALGLSAVGDVPSRVDGDWPGELWALMLDTKSTFDALVTRHAATPEQADAILQNRLYRNISGVLSGTHEYMAMEKLYELHEQGRSQESGDDDAPRFDLVVVDTPPTRNALDFVEAPRRLMRLLDNRIFRLLMVPTRAYLRAMSVASQAFLRTVSKVVGTEVVSDVVAFFRAFEGMEEGFRQRAQDVHDLITSDASAFVLVASPARDAVREAAYFADKLAEAGIPTSALVVNRVHPRFGDAAFEGGSGGDSEDGSGSAPATTALAPFYANLAEFVDIARREESHFATLAARVAPAPVARVPFLPADVHDLEGLRAVADELFLRPGSRAPGY